MVWKSHYLTFLTGSPFPLLAMFSSYNMLISFILLLKFKEFNFFFLSTFILTLICLLWWFSYSSSFTLEGVSSVSLESGIKFSMLLFISSEVFFFFSFFWSYFSFLLSPNFLLGLGWPPAGLLMFDFMNIPLLNSIILLSSGVSVTASHYYGNLGKFINFCFYLGLTIFLGLLFSFCQIIEYNNSFFCLSDSSFGSCFFLMTGFHGIHVVLGSLFLLYVFVLSLWLKKSNFLSFELSSWYWHFVDVVWIFLYFSVYVYGV